MLFSGIPFLFYFLPCVLALYFIVPKTFKNGVLLLFSLLFYAWGEPRYVALMVATIGLFYGCGLAIGKSESQQLKKFWLAVSVVLSLTSLAVFKYADFLIGTVGSLAGAKLGLLNLALPIGISFYTFQCLSYTIDVYRGRVEPQKNIIDFGAYVSLFPQLIAGPIVRYADIARQLQNRTHSWEKISEGLRRFLIGLSKKILLANSFGQLTALYADTAEKSVVFCWVYAIAFTLQIYFDFSGYSDMAIGLGKVFGFDFMENFDYPYMSSSITEFWRRWHISLGSWFRDYVYIPLGGNRVKAGRWVINVLVVWMLTGLWHGAAWNFVLWGLLYGVFLMLEKWGKSVLDKAPILLRRIYVLLIVVLGFVLFNAESLPAALADLGGMFGFAGLPVSNQLTTYYLRSYGVLLLAGVVGATPLMRNLFRKWQNTKVFAIVEPVLLLAALLVCTAYLVDGSFNPFLYFRF